MSAAAAAAVKAAILALTDENTRKKIGWVLAAILSPVILLIAFLCALGSGTASHNPLRCGAVLLRRHGPV